MALELSLMMTRTVVRDNWRVAFLNALIAVIGVIYTSVIPFAYIASVIWPRSGSPIWIQLSVHRGLRDLAARTSNFGCGTGRRAASTDAE
jgi:hypothetical protein